MIKIDMEMPKSCAECELCYYDSGDFDENLSIPTCPLLDCEVDGFKKHKNCPLQEVKE